MNIQALNSELERIRNNLKTLVSEPPVSHLDVGDDFERVWASSACTLQRYRPSRNKAEPLLICFALVNSPRILHLNEQHSFIKQLNAMGFEVYCLEWGNVKCDSSHLSIRHYIEEAIKQAVVKIHDEVKKAPHLVGVCQGGVLAALFSAKYPTFVASLTLLVTPGNCNLKGDYMRSIALNTKPLLAAHSLPYIEHVHALRFFLSLRPVSLQFNKYVKAKPVADRRFFYDMENWIYNGPAVSTRFLIEYIELCYEKNAFYKNTVWLDNEPVSMSCLRCPVLNIIAERDHIVLPDSSRSIKDIFPAARYSELALPSGHIGLFVNNTTNRNVACFMKEKLT